MKRGGVGGGNTVTGLRYEERVDVRSALSKIPGYRIVDEPGIVGSTIYYQQEKVARIFVKQQFYRFLDEQGVKWKERISKKLLPDSAMLVVVRETLFIIEVKFQMVAGSVDEKLQTCDFKRKQYQKLVHDLGLKVEYVYVLSEWFRDRSYKDVLNYIHSVNCHYMFDNLPLAWLGLPGGEADGKIDLLAPG